MLSIASQDVDIWLGIGDILESQHTAHVDDNQIVNVNYLLDCAIFCLHTDFIN